MRTYRGVIKSWKQQQGFGFIRSTDHNKDIFIHGSHIKNFGGGPKVGDKIWFELVVGKDGKLRAYDACIEGYNEQTENRKARVKAQIGHSGIQREHSDSNVTLLGPRAIIALIPFCFSAFLIIEKKYFLPLFLYVLMSLATFLIYAVDKSKAYQRKWRVRESTLHIMELLGGWPGALLTQEVIRHKTSKATYQSTFWTIVVAHLAIWVGYLFLGWRIELPSPGL